MQLREATGAPITACKSALLDSAGDLPKLQKFCVGLEVVDKKQGVTWVKGLWMPIFMDKVGGRLSASYL